MRFIFTAISVCFSLISFGQSGSLPVDPSSGKVTYFVSSKSSLGRDKTFLKCKDWAVTTFNNYDRVVKFEDKDLAKLRLNGATRPGDGGYSYFLTYYITISCTDSTYNFLMTDIERQYTDNTIPVESDYSHHLKNKARREELTKLLSVEKPARAHVKEAKNLDSFLPKWDKEMDDINLSLQAVNDSFKDFMLK